VSGGLEHHIILGPIRLTPNAHTRSEGLDTMRLVSSSTLFQSSVSGGLEYGDILRLRLIWITPHTQSVCRARSNVTSFSIDPLPVLCVRRARIWHHPWTWIYLACLPHSVCLQSSVSRWPEYNIINRPKLIWLTPHTHGCLKGEPSRQFLRRPVSVFCVRVA
jgi:hypothetical protein